ncbi:MAG: hypothetical protein Q7S84_00395 [bacterium]|nr:hypothetical protein [bacterium]
MTNLSEQIYAVLTKRKYNRGEPHLKSELRGVIDAFIDRGEPVKLVGFWGTGPKAKSNWADTATCEFLAALNTEVKAVYSYGIEFTFIFATFHGIHNGYEKFVISSYVRDMGRIFNGFGFKYLYLDALWKKYGISFEKIDMLLNQKPTGWWAAIENREVIEKNAQTRNKRLPANIAAQKYYVMRDLEKEMLEKEFGGYIFHAFSDPDLKNVLPEMPTLYLYARKSRSSAPWFVTEEKPQGVEL